MIRLSIALFFAFIGITNPTASFAQANQRAYAPENIGQLSVNDQIRVIENEYREQSRGRQIPDDQLDFYLDQIRLSRWTFSKIKNDIATSLRGSNGNNGNWRPPTDGNWNQTSVICSSNNGRYQECRAPFRGRARLVENISNARCVEGQNWGARQNIVWVNNGCRGRFADSGNNWGNGNASGQTVRCESKNGSYRECRKMYSGSVYLARQLSSQNCVEGRSWGQNSKSIWVNGGCRAEFASRNGNGNGNWNGSGGYSVTCSSYNGKYKTCAWDRNRGTPRLIDHISGRCNERYDWGYDSNRGIWVANNCSARFGVR
jgi:hypothetical protein